jgi:lipoprotein-anchoring transpeptidase ErfK/SrfK
VIELNATFGSNPAPFVSSLWKMMNVFLRNLTSGVSGTALIVAGALFLVSVESADAGLFDKLKERREQRMKEKRAASRPRPQHRSHYRDAHGDAYINQALLDAAGEESERRVVIDIDRQRAFLIIDDLIAIDTAVSTGRGSRYTPRGTFSITERIRSGKVSTIYHVYMPYWQRLGSSKVGMHVGDLPGYPASAGCIRLPQSVAPILFENTTRGVTVEVMDSWDEDGLRLPYSYPTPMMFAGV